MDTSQMGNPATTGPKTGPDFQILLEGLRREASAANELVGRAYSLAATFKPIPQNEPTPISRDTEKSDPGIIAMFWVEVERLRTANAKLYRVIEHLETMTNS